MNQIGTIGFSLMIPILAGLLRMRLPDVQL